LVVMGFSFFLMDIAVYLNRVLNLLVVVNLFVAVGHHDVCLSS
jgi:hypothetical protein